MMVRAAVVVAVVLLLAGCATKGQGIVFYEELPPAIVGSTEGDTIETIPGNFNEKRTTVVSVIRAFESNGKLALCGAVVLAAPSSDILYELEAYVADGSSDITVGEGPVAVKVTPRFLHRHMRTVPSGVLEAADIDMTSLQGACALTQVPWRSELRSRNRLNLRKTIVTRGSTYVPIYIPQQRRR